MKLLAKTAEDRYQRPRAAADLEGCQAMASARPHRSVPARRARCVDQLPIPQRLYGRERRSRTLLAAFERVAGSGRPSWCWSPAIPASASRRWSTNCTRRWCRRAAYSRHGKFDQYKRDIPYATLAQAFQGLVRPLLARTRPSRPGGATADEALGPNGQLIIDVVPELELLIGEQPPVAELPARQQAQSRLQLVFRRFLGVSRGRNIHWRSSSTICNGSTRRHSTCSTTC